VSGTGRECVSKPSFQNLDAGGGNESVQRSIGWLVELPRLVWRTTRENPRSRTEALDSGQYLDQVLQSKNVWPPSSFLFLSSDSNGQINGYDP